MNISIRAKLSVEREPVIGQTLIICVDVNSVEGIPYRQNSLSTIPGRYITIPLVLRSTRPDQAFFGVINDNLTFDDIVRCLHQNRYNQFLIRRIWPYLTISLAINFRRTTIKIYQIEPQILLSILNSTLLIMGRS